MSGCTLPQPVICCLRCQSPRVLFRTRSASKTHPSSAESRRPFPEVLLLIPQGRDEVHITPQEQGRNRPFGPMPCAGSPISLSLLSIALVFSPFPPPCALSSVLSNAFHIHSPVPREREGPWPHWIGMSMDQGSLKIFDAAHLKQPVATSVGFNCY